MPILHADPPPHSPPSAYAASQNEYSTCGTTTETPRARPTPIATLQPVYLSYTRQVRLPRLLSSALEHASASGIVLSTRRRPVSLERVHSHVRRSEFTVTQGFGTGESVNSSRGVMRATGTITVRRVHIPAPPANHTPAPLATRAPTLPVLILLPLLVLILLPLLLELIVLALSMPIALSLSVLLVLALPVLILLALLLELIALLLELIAPAHLIELILLALSVLILLPLPVPIEPGFEPMGENHCETL
ncbi:hypothetical protein C8J57DRAFT_1512192 [Mycena rebaudengoi]|nr:hypothetical protein C8J57DRAFT_1512192 [Mycena rebaudengoi]